MLRGEEYIKQGRPMLIYTYSTVHLLKKDKVRFYYALKGRDGKTGVVKRFKIVHLGRTVLMVEAKYDDDIIQFFKVWNLPYSRREVYASDEVTRGGPP